MVGIGDRVREHYSEELGTVRSVKDGPGGRTCLVFWGHVRGLDLAPASALTVVDSAGSVKLWLVKAMPEGGFTSPNWPGCALLGLSLDATGALVRATQATAGATLQAEDADTVCSAPDGAYRGLIEPLIFVRNGEIRK